MSLHLAIFKIEGDYTEEELKDWCEQCELNFQSVDDLATTESKTVRFED